jgi:hypothetical protein
MSGAMAFRPARIDDMARMEPVLAPRRAMRIAAQIADHPAWALERDGMVVAVCGVAPFDGDVLECWLWARRGALTAPCLLRILRQTAMQFPDMALLARIRIGNAAGERMALLAGFFPAETGIAHLNMRDWIRPPRTVWRENAQNMPSRTEA